MQSDEDIQERTERTTNRLNEAADMEAATRVTLAVWQWGILFQAATDTASTAVTVTAERGETLEYFVVGARMSSIIEGVMGPLQDQNPGVFEAGPSVDLAVSMTVSLSALTQFLSLAVGPIVKHGLVRPTGPAPTDDETMVSDGLMLWYGVNRMAAHFPPAVLTVLIEETGLDFTENWETK